MTVGDIMSTVGDILNTVGDTQYRGGCHDAMEDIMSTMGVFSIVKDTIFFHFIYPHGTQHVEVLNTPTVLMISPTCIMLVNQKLSLINLCQKKDRF